MKANRAAQAATVRAEGKCGIAAQLEVQGFFLTGMVVK